MTTRNIVNAQDETVASVSSAKELQDFLMELDVVAAVGDDWVSLSMRDLGVEDLRFEGEA